MVPELRRRTSVKDRPRRKESVERRTINTRISMVDHVLNSITNRSEDLPASGTLTLRPQTAGARISGRNWGKQIWGNGGVRAIEIVKGNAQSPSLVAQVAVGLNNGLSCSADGSSHNAINWFLLVIPSNLLDERKPCPRQTNFQSKDIRASEKC
jgi:hypothetical protein